MSIPFLNFTCGSCEYHSTSFVTFGEFLWNYEGQTFNFDRQLGVCQDCKAVVAMENFPELHEFEEAKKLHPELRGKFVNPLTESYVRQLASRKGFEVLERVMEIRRLPVCLKCGGTDVKPVVLPEVPDGAKRTDMALTPLEIKHPGCGGRLQVKGSGRLRIGANPATYYFDIYGRALKTPQDSSIPRIGELFSPATRKSIKAPKKGQDWRPDWAAFKKQGKAVEITFDDPELDIFLFKVDVVEERKSCFRIYSYAFSDVLYWGDLFEGEFQEQDTIRFLRLLDRPKYFHFAGYYPPENILVPLTRQEWCERLPYLQRVINLGGFWEYNGHLGQYIAIPEECLKDFPEFEDRVPVVLKEPS